MEITNGYLKGMNKDLAKSKFGNQQYYHGQNIRVMTDEGLSTGVVENIKGNKYKFNLNGYKYCGSCNVRDKIIIFATTWVTGQETEGTWTSYILELIDDGDTSSVQTPTVLYDDSAVTGSLNFRTDRPVQAVGRYEREYSQKVYFCDYYEQLRSVNIVTLEDSASSVAIENMDVVPGVDMSIPFVSNIGVGGEFTTGVVQYFYQLYKEGGSESAYSPASSLIPLVPENQNSATTYTYKGPILTDEEVNKYIEVTIDNIDTDFDYIKVFQIFYDSRTGSSTITQIKEDLIDGSEYIFIDDNSVSLGTLLESEYQLIKALYTAKSLEEKDNLLVMGNVKEIKFGEDVEDWDARAYRFNTSGYSVLYQDNDQTKAYVVYSAGTTKLGAGGSASLGDWEYFSDAVNDPAVLDVTSYANGGSLNGSNFTIPETADCVNISSVLNDEASFGTQVYHLQSDSSTRGGEGVNISYTFKTKTLTMDSNYQQQYPYVDESSFAQTVNGVTIPNTKFAGTLSPMLDGFLKGYQRDEVYRFGIVLYDDKKRQSDVKWIGDIRMPSHKSIGKLYEADTVTTKKIESETLYVEFTVENLPSSVAYYEIVRVKRTDTNKTIIGAGYVNPKMYLQSDGISPKHTPGVASNIAADPTRLIQEFISPEFLFGSYNFNENDCIVYEGSSTSEVFFDTDSGIDIGRTAYKFKTFTEGTKVSALIYDGEKVISDKSTLSNQESSDYSVKKTLYSGPTNGNISYYNYSFADNLKTKLANREDTVVISSEDFPTAAQLSSAGISGFIYATYRRPRISQYGGFSYESKTQNTYMSTGSFISSSESTVDVFGGDIYISMFDYMFCNYDYSLAQSSDTASSSEQVVMYFPVETTYNTRNRSDYVLSSISDGDYRFVDKETWFLFASTNTELTQKYTYLFNERYRRENDLIIYTPKQLNERFETVNDVMIRASEKKFNGEVIDNWTKWYDNTYIEADSKYGPINNITSFRDEIFFHQDKAAGYVAINERAVLSQGDISELVLGTSGVLSRYEYISTESGCKHINGVTASQYGLYWFDVLNKQIMAYNGGTKELSLLNGVSSYFNNNITQELINTDDVLSLTPTGVILHYDKQFDEVLITIHDATNDFRFTVAYNEFMGSFTSFYTFTPNFYFNSYNWLYSGLQAASNQKAYTHHVGEYGDFYDTYYMSYIEYIINGGTTRPKVFNNIKFLSEVYDSAGVQQHDETMTNIFCSNDYQDTADVSLTSPTTIRRRMREWNAHIPRSSTLEPTTGLEPRMRDIYLKLKLSFNNDNNRRLILHDLTTKMYM